MAKHKQSNLIASVKMLNIDAINKYTINLEIGGGGSYPVSSDYQSFLSNLISLAPPPNYFSVNCRRNTVNYSM